MREQEQEITGQQIIAAFERACAALLSQVDYLTGLDQAMGDGDLGITIGKIARALQKYIHTAPVEDLSRFLITAGMETNKAGSSTMGTLLATGLMRAGKEARGLTSLTPASLVTLLKAAEQGMQERGKANLGDKTVLDALHPAVAAFEAAVAQNLSLSEAGARMLSAAEDGMESVRPLRSKVGRAGWVGERTAGLIDPGCATLVIIIQAVISA